ncbi:hypothetical protein [Alkalibacillus haloalkaliphilus]|uniref:Apea-like HEPN domain-containing protein n=1 Tax=Alkalibacillus haloalkaliphilus TaxID=94136 RepID=A0A511W6L7_9BACI|nr:hypothetical protein [Alkalibacillus haloalkaliphilus]GEN46740.1 hypothetical protein AHA02nite_25160 [Alkalibacillus haloalkaliphilus]
MGLKVVTRIKLPYIIRMKESKEITSRLSPTEHFSKFEITFYPNCQDYEPYNADYPNNNCLFIDVEAVTEIFSFEDYNHKVINHISIYELPDDDRKLIFGLLRERLNTYLEALNIKTKMFWVEGLSMNPLSKNIGIKSQFIFLHPNQSMNTSFRAWYEYWDNYQTELETGSKQITPIDGSIVDECDNLVIVGSPWMEFVNKAKVALFESEFNDFIIYSSIAAEAFIKQLTEPKIYGMEKDIVLEKLMVAGNNKVINSYYNIILKYLTGHSLYEIDPKLYNSLHSIYKFRNALMHTGNIDYNTLRKVGYEGREELTFDVCKVLLENLQATIKTVGRLFSQNIK